MGTKFRPSTNHSDPGQTAYVLAATTTGVETIPAKCRYFKSDVATTMIVRLRNDSTSISLPVVVGTNIEDVGWVYNPASISTAKIVFLG